MEMIKTKNCRKLSVKATRYIPDMLFYPKAHLKGFTLLELLVVIAIIGIMAATLFIILDPRSQRQRARIAAFKEQLGMLTTGISSCTDSGGTVQDPGDNPDRRICSTGTEHGIYLLDSQMKNCSGSGSYTVAVAGDGILGTCNLLEGVDCIAFCDLSGCVFGANCDQ